jgi:putative ABC transport system permease protein
MTIFHDLRLAFRSTIRSVGFSATTIIVMALGVGATTFAFVAINGMILQPLPYPDADELVHIELISAENPNGFEIGLHDLRDLAERQTSFRSLFAVYSGTINVSGEDRPVRYDGTFVTANAFDQLGVPPALGRTFTAGEDVAGAPIAVVIGWDIWQQRYGADPAVIGASIRVNGAPATIVGVMPNGFMWPTRNEIWVPMQQDTVAEPRAEATVTVEAFGRLRTGVTLEQARAEFATLYAGILQANPGWNVGATTDLKPYREEFVGPQTMAILTAMQLATALVLLIACANVANLILARTVGRSRELSVRAALGASRWRLVAGTLTESVGLSLVGGMIGILIAHAAARGVERYLVANDDGFPYWVNFGADWRVALFALAVAGGAGIVAGVLPALRGARRDVTAGLKSSGGGGTGIGVGRFTRALIGVEIALSCALLVGGALTVRSVINLQHAPIGADVAGVMSGRIGLFDAQYPDTASRRQFWEALEAQVAELPGVTGTSVTTSLPTYGAGGTRYLPAGHEPPADGLYPFARTVVVTPGFFDMFRVPVTAGRTFTSADREDTLPVVMVNRAFAERTWPDESPVGKRLLLAGTASTRAEVTVIGVAGDVYHHNLQAGAVQPAIYQPLAQADARFASIAARTDGDPDALANPIRDALRAVDPDLPAYWVQPARVWVDQSRSGPKLLGIIFSVFGIAAVLLASVGVYGVLAFTVAQRTREFGIRRALGAEQGGILGLVLRQGVRQLAIALPVGLVLAFGLGRILGGVLANVSSVDPLSFLGVPVLLALIVVVASLVPARRAARVNPMTALRYE